MGGRTSLGSALERSCANQNSACAYLANTNAGLEGLTTAECDAQQS
jgi:hypothetical protein